MTVRTISITIFDLKMTSNVIFGRKIETEIKRVSERESEIERKRKKGRRIEISILLCHGKGIVVAN